MNTNANSIDTTTAEFKTWLTQHLNEGTMRVTFLKRDGSSRTMNCTTNPKVTPIPVITRKNTDVVTVFDVDIKDWRSFRLDRIKTAEPVAAY